MNMTSKTLQALKDDPRVHSVHTEMDGWGDTAAEIRRKSYWVYLHPGYICHAMECGTIHEKTVKKCWEMMRTVEPLEGGE
jgi:hypothetical protein